MRHILPAVLLCAALAWGARPTACCARAAGRNLATFDAAWAAVAQKYYDPHFRDIDWAKAWKDYRPQAAAAENPAALHAVINRMLGLLHDPHSHLMRRDAARYLRSEKAVDVGPMIKSIDHARAVERVVPGSPAEAAGVQPGWLVVKVNGFALDDPANAGLDPASGSVLRIDFLDSHDRPAVRDLRFQKLAVKSESRALPHGGIYLRFDRFNFTTLYWLSRQIADADAASTPPPLIIDVRDNPGGGLQLAGALLREFFSHPVDFGTLTVRGQQGTRLHVNNFLSPRYSAPVAILVDAGTASSAEIFAAVMQEQHRAAIVGRRTAGAVLGGELMTLPDGAVLEVSVADYVLPSGRHLDGVGVTPDVPVPERGLADLRSGRDRDLEAAEKILGLGA